MNNFIIKTNILCINVYPLFVIEKTINEEKHILSIQVVILEGVHWVLRFRFQRYNVTNIKHF